MTILAGELTVLPVVMSVNVGTARPTEHSGVAFTAIDKRPAAGPVRISVPRPGSRAGRSPDGSRRRGG